MTEQHRLDRKWSYRAEPVSDSLISGYDRPTCDRAAQVWSTLVVLGRTCLRLTNPYTCKQRQATEDPKLGQNQSSVSESLSTSLTLHMQPLTGIRAFIRAASFQISVTEAVTEPVPTFRNEPSRARSDSQVYQGYVDFWPANPGIAGSTGLK